MSLTQPYLAHLTGVFHAPSQAWSRHDGTMGTGAEGIYCGDERVVRSVRLSVAEHELRHISTQVRSASEVVFVHVLTVPAEVVDPLVTVHQVRLSRLDGVEEELRVCSALGEAVAVTLELVLGLDRDPHGPGEERRDGRCRASPARAEPRGRGGTRTRRRR